MSKRARYVGPDPEVPVYDPDNVYAPPIAVVAQNAYLPSELPQKLHQELGAMDHWRLEDAPSQSSARKDGDS